MNRCIIRASAKALRSAVLVVPVVLDDAGVVVVRQVRETVQVEQHLAVGLVLQRREQGIVAQLDMGILAGLPAAEEFLAGCVVLQVEGEGLAMATLRLPALDRHAAGDEVHRASPPPCRTGCSREPDDTFKRPCQPPFFFTTREDYPYPC
jgi:hypothetical protein